VINASSKSGWFAHNLYAFLYSWKKLIAPKPTKIATANPKTPNPDTTETQISQRSEKKPKIKRSSQSPEITLSKRKKCLNLMFFKSF